MLRVETGGIAAPGAPRPVPLWEPSRSDDAILGALIGAFNWACGSFPERSRILFKETGQFRAKTADGRQIFTVIERAKVIIDIFDGKRQERLGTRDYCLDTGQDVSPISDDEFFILPNGPTIYRIR